MASEKSRILIIGGTGFVGQFIVHASARAGHPTFALVRESSAASDPAKTKVLEDFKAAGVKLVYGDFNDHENLVKAIKDVDVVISTVGHGQIADQSKIIAAVKEAGNVKVNDLLSARPLVKDLQGRKEIESMDCSRRSTSEVIQSGEGLFTEENFNLSYFSFC